MLILAVNHYLAIAFLAIGLQNQASDVPNWIKIYAPQLEIQAVGGGGT